MKPNKYKQQLELLFKAYQLDPVREYKFHPERKWRFDYAFPSVKIALEYEGGIWVNGGHNRGLIYSGNCEKYNAATMLGWQVYRITCQQFKNGYATNLIERIAREVQENVQHTEHLGKRGSFPGKKHIRVK